MPLSEWEASVESPPPFMTDEDRSKWLSKMDKVALASDAFFPFRDNIDRAVQVIMNKIVIYFFNNAYKHNSFLFYSMVLSTLEVLQDQTMMTILLNLATSITSH